MERVGEGDAIDRPTVIQMVSLMEPLYEQMESAVPRIDGKSSGS